MRDILLALSPTTGSVYLVVIEYAGRNVQALDDLPRMKVMIGIGSIVATDNEAAEEPHHYSLTAGKDSR